MLQGTSTAIATAPLSDWGRTQWALTRDRVATMQVDPRHARLAGLTASAAMGAVVCYALRNIDTAMLSPVLSGSALFWFAFLANYLHGPAAETLMFRRLWPPAPGLFGALVRKQIANALVLPYAGDALLLHWARGHGIRPFAAIKDAAILAALAGSTATLTLVLPVWMPLSASLGLDPSSLLGSLALLSSIPFAALATRDRVFALPTAELGRIAAIHAARVFANIGLMALCWHLLLPSEALGSWLLLSAARMVVSRLPIVPNKEIAMGAVAVMMFPDAPQVAGVVAATGVLFTLAHVVTWVPYAGLRRMTSQRAGVLT